MTNELGLFLSVIDGRKIDVPDEDVIAALKTLQDGRSVTPNDDLGSHPYWLQCIDAEIARLKARVKA